MSPRGFTFVELLIATLVTLAVAAALAAVSGPARAMFERMTSTSDLTVRTRGLERLVSEVRESGHAGPSIGMHSIVDVWPRVTVQSSIDDPSVNAPWRAIRIAHVPGDAGQAVLLSPISTGERTLTVETTARCPIGGEVCGFEAGAHVAIHDAARAELVTIESANADGTIRLADGVSTSFVPGAFLQQVRGVIYGLRAAADGSWQLVRISDGGAEQPIVDGVVEFGVRVFGRGDPPQIQTVTALPVYGPQPPLPAIDDPRDIWPVGEHCTFALDADGNQQARLTVLAGGASTVSLGPADLSDGPWCPDAVSPSRFDADWLRLTRVDFVLRVEAPAAFRGSVAALFRRPGAARRAADWIPDREIHVSVALRSR